MAAVSVPAKYIYRELLKKIVEMFKTGKSPLDIAETIEIVAFIAAANKSGAQPRGRGVDQSVTRPPAARPREPILFAG